MSLFIATTTHPDYPVLTIEARDLERATVKARSFIKQWFPKGMRRLRKVSPVTNETTTAWDGYYTTRLPFEGFESGSRYGEMVDHEESSWVDYEVDERQDEEGIPRQLQLNHDELWTIINRHTEYSVAYDGIAEDYVSVFSLKASENLGFKDNLLGLHIESTDTRGSGRIFAYIHPLVLQWMLARSAVTGHVALQKIIERDFTSYSGFSSHYKNEVDVWLEKSLEDWDHNELCALVEAMVIPDGDDEFSWSIYYNMSESSYEYWSAAVNWTNVHADIQEKRDEKEEDLKRDDPDYVAPPRRCELTLDLFQGATK